MQAFGCNAVQKTKISLSRPIPNSLLLCVFIQTGRLNRQHQGPSKPFTHGASVFPKYSQSQCMHPLQRHLKAPGTKKSAWLWKEKIPFPSTTSNWKSNDMRVCRYCRVAVQSQHIQIVSLLFTAVVLSDSLLVPLLWKRPLWGWCTHPRPDFQHCSINSDRRFSFLNTQRGSQDAWRDRTVAMTLQLHILVRVGLFLCTAEIHIITVLLPESSRIRSTMHILPEYWGQNEMLALQPLAKYGWVKILLVINITSHLH